MRNESKVSRALLISAVFALVIMALLFDFVTAALQVSNSQGSGLEPLLVVLFPLFEMLLVFGGMGLFWYVFSGGRRSRAAIAVFTIVGLLLLYGLPLLYFLPVPQAMLVLVQFVQPGTYVFQAGALLFVTGILAWLIKQPAPAEALGAADEPAEFPAGDEAGRSAEFAGPES